MIDGMGVLHSIYMKINDSDHAFHTTLLSLPVWTCASQVLADSVLKR